MWWDDQDLDKPRRDKSGKRWNFRVWYDSIPAGQAQRVSFEDGKEHCGVVLLPPGSTPHVSRVHALINKLIADPQLRKQNRRELNCPLDITRNTGPSQKNVDLPSLLPTLAFVAALFIPIV